MTAVSVSFDGTRMNDAEVIGTVWTTYAGKAATLETDAVYQNTYSASAKVSSASGGVCYTHTAGVAFSTGPKIALMTCTVTNIGVLGNEGSGGAMVNIGSNGITSNYYSLYIIGKDTWPPFKRWLFPCIDPNEVAYRDATNGTPNLASVNGFGFYVTMTGAAKAENVAQDGISYVTAGQGLTLVNGDGADADGTFQSFLSWDEGTQNNRYGVVFSVAGDIFCNLALTIGSATATVFTSVNEVLTFTKQWVGVGAQGLKFDLQSASTAVTLTNDVCNSEGVDDLKSFFDTELQVSSANDEVTFSSAHGYSSGQYVLYSKEGDSEAIGLTDATSYWVRAISSTVIAFYSTRQAAMTGGTKVGLTASSSGNGKNHSIRRAPRTTPFLTVSGTSGTMTVTGCNFVRFGVVTSTSKPTWTSCSFVNAKSIDPGGAAWTSCSFNGMSATGCEGEELMSGTVASLEAITNSTFTAGARGGHGYKVTGTASQLDLSNVTWTGYGIDPTPGKGMPFHTITSVDATNDEIDYTSHGWTTGDPVYYSKYNPTSGALGTDSLNAGITDGKLLYVRSVTSGSISLHYTRWAAENNSNKINLTAGSTGETHTIYSANAALVNNTGSSMTVSVTGGTSPSVRNVGAALTTVVTGSVPFTVTVKTTAGAALQYARVLIMADTGGPYPYQDAVSITRSGSTATVSHSGHGLTSGEYVVITGATQDEYNGVFSITVTDDNTYTYTVSGTPDTPATGSPVCTLALVYGLTNASGVVTASRSYSSDQPFVGWARISTSSPVYQQGDAAGTLDKDVGQSLTIQMVEDS